MASLGFDAIGVVRDEDESAALTEAASRDEVSVQVVEADLGDSVRRAAVLENLELYALVNNAGFMNAGLLRDVPDEEARNQLEVMVIAPLDLARRALPFMLTRGEGRIVNVTSAAVHTSTPFTGWYQACKAALRELTDALRVELAGTGIDVVDVEPGGFATGIWARGHGELLAHQARSARPEAYDRPLEALARFESKLGDPTEVAEAIGHTLTAGHPRFHQRIGPGANVLRTVAELVPDRLWDRAMARASDMR